MQAEERTTTTTSEHQRPTDDNASSNGQTAHGDEHQIPVDLPEVSGKAMVVIGVSIVVLFVALFLLGWIPHRREQAEARKEAQELKDVKPVVDVTQPKRSDAPVDLLLPANVEAFQQTSMFARTSGYLKPLQAGIDIGAKVKAGQLLAEISAPEVDAELEQQRAALQQAHVTVGRATNEYNYNKATFDRYSGLSQTGGVTQQQLDEKRASFNIASSSLKAAEASVLAAEASVKRLTELQGFQKVVAPFDGIITARNYDSGALISATPSGTAGRELFQIKQTDTLRVFVNVPQSYATEVHPDQTADLLVRNYPGKPFAGKLARTAGAIDPQTRTLRVEVDIPNADGTLFPGMYGQVRFKIKQSKPPVVIPTSALVIGADGVRVAVVEAGNKVRFQTVDIGRDFGAEAEVVNGLNGDERIVTNPGERLADGVEVKVTSKAPAAAGPQAKPPAQAAAR